MVMQYMKNQHKSILGLLVLIASVVSLASVATLAQIEESDSSSLEWSGEVFYLIDEYDGITIDLDAWSGLDENTSYAFDINDTVLNIERADNTHTLEISVDANLMFEDTITVLVFDAESEDVLASQVIDLQLAKDMSFEAIRSRTLVDNETSRIDYYTVAYDAQIAPSQHEETHVASLIFSDYVRLDEYEQCIDMNEAYVAVDTDTCPYMDVLKHIVFYERYDDVTILHEGELCNTDTCFNKVHEEVSGIVSFTTKESGRFVIRNKEDLLVRTVQDSDEIFQGEVLDIHAQYRVDGTTVSDAVCVLRYNDDEQDMMFSQAAYTAQITPLTIGEHSAEVQCADKIETLTFTVQEAQSTDFISTCQALDKHTILTENILLAELDEGAACFTVLADDVTLDCQDNSIIGFGSGLAVAATDVSGLTVKNCHFSGAADVADISNSRDVTFVDSTIAVAETGINARDSDNVRINNLFVSDALTGFVLENIVSARIEANTFTGNDQAVIVSNGLDVDMNSNDFIDAGVAIDMSASDESDIVSNTFDATTHAIIADDLTDSVITTNSISNGDNGVMLTGDLNRLTVTNNTFDSLELATSIDSDESFTLTANTYSNSAIAIDALSDDLRVEGVDIAGAEIGVRSDGTYDLSIVDSSFTQNNYAVSFANTFATVVQSNTFDANTFAIHTQDTSDLAVESNTFTNSAVASFYAEGENSLFAIHNDFSGETRISIGDELTIAEQNTLPASSLDTGAGYSSSYESGVFAASSDTVLSQHEYVLGDTFVATQKVQVYTPSGLVDMSADESFTFTEEGEHLFVFDTNAETVIARSDEDLVMRFDSDTTFNSVELFDYYTKESLGSYEATDTVVVQKQRVNAVLRFDDGAYSITGLLPQDVVVVENAEELSLAGDVSYSTIEMKKTVVPLVCTNFNMKTKTCDGEFIPYTEVLQ